MNLLLVEDDPVLADGLTHALLDSGYSVTHEVSGLRADKLLVERQFDLVILDLGLPDMDGTEVLSRLRQRGNSLPVMVLTARNTLNDRVQGLNYGADDYLAKPFALPELEARIRALLRRRKYSSEAQLQLGGLCLHADGHDITYNNESLGLMARELSVLKVLMLQAGHVVSKEKLCAQISTTDDEVSVGALEVYVHRLRKKLELRGIQIRTMRGLGYLLEAP